MGMQPIIFAKKSEHENMEKAKKHKPWIPEANKVPIQYFENSRQLTYLFPAYDRIGLRKVFRKYRCDIVHAHNVATAYYAYKLGLPTIFDDWEYHYEYFDYLPIKAGLRAKQLGKALLALQRKIRVKKIVLELIRKFPVIVTNDEVESRYRELGAKSVWWIPNVPLSFEREYAFSVDVKRGDRITTCYVGAMTLCESDMLTNTSGVKKLWTKHNIGNLLILENENYVPHLETLRRLRGCHFNLLFWNPLSVHRYYLQNKPFLASVVGVPTIISSSLKTTIKLLGEYALTVESLEEIPKTIKDFDFSAKYHLNEAHLWEHYQHKIEEAYRETALCDF
jgi:hypothetical protein